PAAALGAFLAAALCPAALGAALEPELEQAATMIAIAISRPATIFDMFRTLLAWGTSVIFVGSAWPHGCAADRLIDSTFTSDDQGYDPLLVFAGRDLLADLAAPSQDGGPVGDVDHVIE